MGDSGAQERATQVLRAVERGEPGSAEAFFELLYGELRHTAGGLLAEERAGHTLQPTALVHEAWVRLINAGALEGGGRARFLGIAAKVMRRILVEHARARDRLKRGGAWRRVELPDEDGADEELEVLAVDAALEELARLSERQARIVELRFFSGLPVEEVAEALGLSARTVEREWRFARAWLAEKLEQGDGA